MSGTRSAMVVCLLLLLPAAHGQQQDPVALVAPDKVALNPKLPAISSDEYLAQIAQMQSLVERCEAQASACGAQKVPDDATVGGQFQTQWDWLQLVLNLAKDGKLSDRAEQLDTAAQRLAEEAQDVSGRSPAVANQDAKAKAELILAQPEFNRVEKKSYLAEKIAALMLLLDQLFEGTGKLLPKAWWVAPTLEYGTLLLAAIAVVLWAWRLNRQERLRIDAGPKPTQAWHAESEDWAQRAEAEAGKANWREAVHCLYWSAIVMLEGQRFWLQNRARTPREYVNLLEPGSERRKQLSGLTRVFERIWYGLRPAAESDYRDAKAMLDQMRVA
jgi:hypothetical protein